MSETITELEVVEELVVGSAAEAVSDEQLISMLVDRARSDGLQLTGEGGLLQQLTKRVLESALEGPLVAGFIAGLRRHGVRVPRGVRTQVDGAAVVGE